MRYCASVDFLVDFRGYIESRPDTFMEAVCRDLEGNPLRVPWLWDHSYKGHPAYWFCTNNPDYQAYLRDQAARACLAPIDGLHIDDYSGTSACSAYNGGCFCEYCMKGFRDYLQKHFSSSQLKEKGIENIKTFDYGDFLKAKDITAEKYKKEHYSIPLIREFQKYQNERMIARITDIYEYAEKQRDKLLVRSINSSASSPRTLIPSPVIDYFCGEVHQHAASKAAPIEPVLIYKLVEALNRRQTATASGQDWAWIKANEKPGLVRTWIAQTYAFGSVFMVPHRQWCYTSELGTHWWHGKVEDFAWLYRFVRDNSTLFDHTSSLADTALIYSMENHSTIRKAAFQLAENNIPYAILIAGNDELPLRLQPGVVAAYKNLIIGDQPLPDNQDDVLKQSNATIYPYKNIKSLPNTIRNQVKVEGSKKIRVSLRYYSKQKDGAIICHLLNQNYQAGNDKITPADVEISIDKALLDKAGNKSDLKSANVLMPKRERFETEVSKNGNKISFIVENLGLWAVVELE